MIPQAGDGPTPTAVSGSSPNQGTSLRSVRRLPIALPAIFLFALLLRSFLFIGYANMDSWDDTIYLRLARQVRRGETFSEMVRETAEHWDGGVTSSINLFVLRRGTYFPIALSQEIFGENEAASALPSLLASLGMVLLIYRLGVLLIDRQAALLGALLFAVVPLDLAFSTRILPDVPQTFLLTASVVASVEGARRSGSRRTRLVFYVLSGVAFYLAYLVRPAGVSFGLLVLAGAFPALTDKRTRFEPLVIPLTVALLSILDGVVYLRTTGQFLFPYRLERAGYLSIFVHHPQALFYPLPGLVVHCSYEFGVPHHLIKMFLGTIQHYGNVKLFSAFAPLGALAVLYALQSHQRRRLWLLVFWLVAVFLYVQYGFRLLRWDAEEGVLHYYLLPALPRYLELLVPPLCLLAGFCLAEIGVRRRSAAALVFLLLAGPSLWRAGHNYRFYRGSLDDMRQASRFLLQQKSPVVYTDPWAVEQLRFFSAERLRDVRRLRESLEPEPGAWVVIGGSRGFDITSKDVASLLPQPYGGIHLDPTRAPPSWEDVFQRKGVRNVGRCSDLAIFHVLASAEAEKR